MNSLEFKLKWNFSQMDIAIVIIIISIVSGSRLIGLFIKGHKMCETSCKALLSCFVTLSIGTLDNGFFKAVIGSGTQKDVLISISPINPSLP